MNLAYEISGSRSREMVKHFLEFFAAFEIQTRFEWFSSNTHCLFAE